ncbi:MAG: PQQ-binding-like beta-propeller repeat protein [Thermomicrobiales bacterium]
MDRNDLRRADNLLSSWDDVALGRAPADPAAVGDEVAELITRLQALGDVPEQRHQEDSARERVWRELAQHPRWKEPDVEPVVFSLNGAIAPPLTLPPRGGWPARPPVFPRWGQTLVQAAIAVLVVVSLLAGYVSLVRHQGPGSPAPALATPTAPGTPAAEWPMYRGNPARTGVMAGPGPVGQPVEVWRYAAQGSASQSLAVADGVAYLQTGDGMVAAIDATTGDQRWQVEAGGVAGMPALVGDTVYVNDAAGAFVALDAATGAERWRFANAVFASASPLIVDGVAYTATDAGLFFALDAATGKERWRYDVGAGSGRSATFAGGIVYFGTADGSLRALDAATGAERWRFDSGNTGEPVKTPTVRDGVVYAAVGDALYALDAATGDEHWRVTTPGARPVTADGQALYTFGLDGVVYALNPADGSERWTFNTTAPTATGPAPALVGDTLYVIGGDQALYALDVATGTERWDFALDGSADNGPSVADGMIYVGTSAGSLYAIGGSGTSQLLAPGSSLTAAALATPSAAAAAASPWQATGDPASPLTAPAGAAVDAAGNIWVVNPIANNIQIIAPDGSFVESWDGTSGGGQAFDFHKTGGGFDGDIAFAPDGRIYVAEPGNSSRRVQVFDTDKNWLATWDTFGAGDGQLMVPQSVAVDAQGNVYVKDNQQRRVQKFSPDGAFLQSFGGPSQEAGGLNDDGYITVDAQGHVLATGYVTNDIAEFSPDGALLARWGTFGNGPGQFRTPVDVATDAFGNIYVAELDNARIQVFDPAGRSIAMWDAGTTPSGKRNAPYAVALDGAGNLYVVGTAPDGSTEGNVLKFRVAPSLVPVTLATPQP